MEKQLTHPSLLAFERFANTMLFKAGTAREDSPQRRQLMEAAVAAAKQGIQYYATIPRRPAPAYVARERILLAAMFTVLGTAAGMGQWEGDRRWKAASGREP